MQTTLVADNIGILSLGRRILREIPAADLKFEITGGMNPGDRVFHEVDFWPVALEKILSQTRFGRIGFFFERKNQAAMAFLERIDPKSDRVKDLYQPASSKRAVKTPEFHCIQTQVLREMALEGMANSVEFRRLARKCIRRAKHAHTDTIFFLDSIFGEEETHRILQHIAGPQIKVLTPSDFAFDLLGADNLKKSETREIQIHASKQSIVFLKKRAEEILKTKLSETDFSL